MKYAEIKNVRDGAVHVQIDAVGCKAGDVVQVVYEYGGLARADVGIVLETMDANPYGSDHRCGYAVAIIPPVSNPARELKRARKRVHCTEEAAANAAELKAAMKRLRELTEIAEAAKKDSEIARLLERQRKLEPNNRQLQDACEMLDATRVAGL